MTEQQHLAEPVIGVEPRTCDGRDEPVTGERGLETIEALVQRAQANDTAAFGAVYDIFCPKIYNYFAYSLNGQIDVAEDLTQEVFMKAFEKLHSYQFCGAPFSAWLYQIAHHQMIDYVRWLKRRPCVPLDTIEHLYEQDHLGDQLTRDTLAGALALITKDQRTVVLLRLVQGLSIAETAQVVGKDQDAVKQLQRRGLKALQRLLTERSPKHGAPSSDDQPRCEPPAMELALESRPLTRIAA